MNVKSEVKISEKTYINPLFVFANNIKINIQKSLEETLGEEAKVANRNITSEIQVKYQRIL